MPWLYFASSTAILLLFFLVTICIYTKYKLDHWTRKNLPHLRSKFPLGYVEPHEPLSVNLKRAYAELRIRGWPHGGLCAAQMPIYCVADLDLIKKILVSDFDCFPYRGMYVNAEIDRLSDTIVAARDDNWRNMKTMFLSAMTGGQLKIASNLLLERLVGFEKIFDALLLQSGSVIKIDEVVECLLLDYLADYVFGLKVNSFDNSREHIFKKQIDRTMNDVSFARKLGNLVKLLYPKFARRIGLREVPQEASDFFLNSVKNVVESRFNNNIVRQDFLQLMLNAKNVDKLEDIQYITAQCLSFFVGSIETSSATIYFALYELAKNPEIQEKLRQEIVMKLGVKTSYESIQNLPYLDQVISETLRKYPPFPIILRKSVKKFKLDHHHDLDEDSLVMISVWGLHFDEEYFPEPEKFDPERFSKENKKVRPKFSYLPFGDGPRRCLGGRFANVEVNTSLIYLLRRYRFSVNYKTETPFRYQEGQSLKIYGGVWLNVEKI